MRRISKANIMNIAVFASGRGTNFQAIINAVKKGLIKANLSLLVCDNQDAFAIERAKKAGIKVVLLPRQKSTGLNSWMNAALPREGALKRRGAPLRKEDFSGKIDFENKIIQCLEENNIDLIVLAGFMRILGPKLVSRYKNRILNIHPALLPSFKGKDGIKDAFEYGAKVTGVTVHFVDERMDHGPIALQFPVKIEESDTLETLEAKIHKMEHKIYPEAIRLFVEGKLEIKGRRVIRISD